MAKRVDMLWVMRGAILTAAVCGSRIASSAPNQKSVELYTEGQRLYAAGAYLLAAAKFEEAYAIEQDPAFLYNVAQSYRQGRACASAVDYYRRFLDAVPAPPELPRIQGYIEDTAACAREQQANAPDPGEPPVRVSRTARSADSGTGKRAIGLISAAVGVAFVGSGVYFGLSTQDLADQRSALCRECTWSPELAARAEDLDRRGRRSSNIAIGSYAVGGAALVGGAVLYMLGRREGARSVVIEPNAGGATVSSSFRF